MFNALFDGLAWLLDFFYTYAGRSYGLSIALLTFTVMMLCFPLTAKGTRGMAAMSKLQPELKKIQQRHKDDRQKQSEETMALFKEHKVSPAGGCLPMLVQAPVFFIMYQVLIGLTRRGEDRTFDPKYLSPGSALHEALDGARTMKSFGIDLAETASDAARASFIGAIPFFAIIACVVATGYYQQRQITRRNPQTAGAADNPYMQSMQRMQKIFPLMYLVFGFTLPAGILIYFLVSNLFRIGQQALIYKMDPSLLPSAGAPIVDAKSKALGGTTAGKGGSGNAAGKGGSGKAAGKGSGKAAGPGAGKAVAGKGDAKDNGASKSAEADPRSAAKERKSTTPKGPGSSGSSGGASGRTTPRGAASSKGGGRGNGAARGQGRSGTGRQQRKKTRRGR